MAVLRLFAGAREAAGTGRDELPGATVGDVLDAARARYGAAFADLLEHCADLVQRRAVRARPAGRRRRRGGRAPAGVGRRRLMATPPGAAPVASRPTGGRGADGAARRQPGAGHAGQAQPAAPAPLRGRLRHRRSPRPARDRSGSSWRRSPSSLGPLADRRRVRRRRRGRGRPDGARAGAAAGSAPTGSWPPAMAGGMALGACLGAGGRRARRPRRHGGRASRWPRRRQVAQPDRSPTPGGRSSARSRWGWRPCRWCCSPGSTRARPSRCCCSCRPTRPATTSSGRAPGTPTRGRWPGIAAITVVTFIVSTLSISAFDVGEAWLFGGARRGPRAARPALRQRAAPRRRRAGVGAAPPRLAAPRRPRVVARRSALVT